MKSGELVWIDFPGVVQTKRRPAVILSSDSYHSTRPDIIVGLVTSQTTKATAPTDFVIQDWQAAGLRVPSAFRAFLVTLPRSAIVSAMCLPLRGGTWGRCYKSIARKTTSRSLAACADRYGDAILFLGDSDK